MPEIRFWQGNTAVAMGAIAAGCRFFGGYPITPSSEIAEIMAVELPKVGGKFIQMEDEIGSIAAVIGASIAGYKAMTATSGPGFSLKQENIGFAYMTEVPIVVVNVMRGDLPRAYPLRFLNKTLCKLGGVHMEIMKRSRWLPPRFKSVTNLR